LSSSSLRLTGRPNPFQQHACRFVARILGHQFATEGLGEEGWGEAIDDLAGGCEAGFELVGEGEEGFDAIDNFFLLGSTRKLNRQQPKSRLTD
jgi:hypothetical protein